MEKEQFLKYVIDTIKSHPEWFADMINATQYAVQERLREEMHKRADAETIVSVLYDKVYKGDKKFIKQLEEKAKQVIKNSNMFQGTEYADSL